LKIKIALFYGAVIFPSLLQTAKPAVWKKKTALKISCSCECDGHNNTKINPVFRGMVRSGEFLTKGKLC